MEKNTNEWVKSAIKEIQRMEFCFGNLLKMNWTIVISGQCVAKFAYDVIAKSFTNAVDHHR